MELAAARVTGSAVGLGRLVVEGSEWGASATAVGTALEE